MSRIELHETNTGFIALKHGQEPVLITDKESIDELRALLEKRNSVGKEITERLKKCGLKASDDDFSVLGVCNHPPGG